MYNFLKNFYWLNDIIQRFKKSIVLYNSSQLLISKYKKRELLNTYHDQLSREFYGWNLNLMLFQKLMFCNFELIFYS